MNNTPGNRLWPPKHVLMFLAIPSLFVLPPVHLLVWGGYPILRTESLLLLGLALFAGLLLTLSLFRYPLYLRLAALIVTVVAGIMVGGVELLSAISTDEEGISTPFISLLSTSIIVGIPSFLLIGLKDNGLVILGGASAAVLISTILFPQPRAPATVIHGALANGNQKLAPVLHIVLDEHTALSQLPAPLAREIESLLNDFRLYPDAYSPFSFTPYAMMATLNPNMQAHEISPDSRRTRWLIEPNEWFDYLDAKGYVISVHQPYMLQYCSSKEIVDRCYTYNHLSVGYLADLDLPALTKFRLIVSRLFLWMRFPPDFPIDLWPTAANKAVEDVARLLDSGARGRAFFLHLTTPHEPYIYDSNCQLRLITESADSEPTQNNLMDNYHAQVRCAWRQIARLLVLLKENSNEEDAIVLLHGDHGLRILPGGVPDTLGGSTGLVATAELSTILAVRWSTLSPGIQPGRIATSRALNALMGNCEEQADSGIGYTVPGRNFGNKHRIQAPVQLQLPPVGPALVPICSPTR